jgi:hypothetical protein
VRAFEPQQFGKANHGTGHKSHRLHRFANRLRHIPWRRARPRTHRAAGIWLMLIMGVAWFASGSEPLAAVETWDRRDILDAIRFVESGDRDDVPDGDDGKAIGPYQIHYVYWFDASEYDPQLGGDYQQCRQRGYAERVITAYMQRHANQAWRIGDGQTIARIHNGGPKGRSKSATRGYWSRVKRRLPAPRESLIE